MLLQAMNSFQVAKRKHKENVKAQYTDKLADAGKKNYFRASELGQGDRKILYGFFAHQLPKGEKSAKNLRQLENGDYVHERYQTAWEEMGALISMEQRLSSKDDEFLAEHEWEWAGHYDGLLDLNIIRAHALGHCTVGSAYNEEAGKWEIEVEIAEAYANAIGLFNENGDMADDYEPLHMVADIKTMNPWGFKTIKEKGDLSSIQGYIDQISFYMYMLNTPYGSIYIEAKDSQDVVEVQVCWSDMHEGEEYKFDDSIHGKQTDGQVRCYIDNGRFWGDEKREGCVPRLDRLWKVKTEIEQADEAGDAQKVFDLMVQRCSNIPNKFPCSWGDGKEKCEYYDHCWNPKHQGGAVRTVEAIPAEAIWEFGDVKIDNRKLPKGMTFDMVFDLVSMGAFDLTPFVIMDVDASEEVAVTDAMATALNEDNLFNSDGELKVGGFAPSANLEGAPSEAQEYKTEAGERAIDCLNCGKQITFKAVRGAKKCPHCNHSNIVAKA